MNSKRLLIVFVGVIMTLCVPLIAMQFTEEVDWSILDFLFAAILLSGFAASIYFIIDRVTNKRVRWLIIGAILLFFALLWAELAVGIFGTPFVGN